MARLDLIGGAYYGRSVLSGAMRCVNLFPEKNRKDATSPVSHYQRPGLRALSASAVAAPGRGIWRASNGNGYCVIGQNLYSIGANWALSAIGTFVFSGATVVSAADNGTTMVIGDGTGVGYQVTLATNAFSLITDPTNIFAGTYQWQYLDTFLLWTLPNSQLFGSSLSNEVVFDPTYVAGKTGYPDKLKTIFVNKRILYLLGDLKSEVWYDAGNSLFPFAILPGAYIEHGIAAIRSVASADTSVFWLAQNLQGIGLILRQKTYETKVISNHAISFAIRQMIANGADVSDAVAYTYTQDGHLFYVITFISGDQTWVYDDAIGDPELAWHQRGWTDSDGVLHRERLIQAAYINGTNVGIDWQNGTIYALDPNYYFDQVTGIAGAINYTRTFPQVWMLDGPNGPVDASGHGMQLTKFTLDLECGNGPIDINGLPASVSLRYSRDRGKTFSASVLQSAGQPGQYETQPKWGPLGFSRFPVFEVNYSFAGQATLNCAWLDGKVATQ